MADAVTCSIDDCDRPVKGRGWCEKHYLRWYRHGDPKCIMPHPLKETAGYATRHRWMNKHFPRLGRCEYCAKTDRRTQYASIGHTYTRNRTDWFELCAPCHKAFDGLVGAQGDGCRRGHPRNEQNTYVRRDGKPMCRVCARAKQRERRRSPSQTP